MDTLLVGTGGVSGWPLKGCRCASCIRAAAEGTSRGPCQVLVDGTLKLDDGKLTTIGTGSSHAGQHDIRELPGGFDVTGPDGGRLLLAAGPGAVPQPPAGSEPFDIALLDLLLSPAQLGWLRSAGLVHNRTAAAAMCTDHRVSSEQEMARRCALWHVTAASDGQLIRGPMTGREADKEPARPHRTLIIGGARSGKSAEAQLRLSGEARVTYVAAGPWPDPVSAGPDGEPDAEWAQRVAAHRAARPPWWRTRETLDVAAVLRAETGAVLVDGIGTWLAAVMTRAGSWPAQRPGGSIEAEISELVEAWRQTSAIVVAVTDQVGSGVVPAYPAGRAFRDQLGWLNQRIAAESDLNLLVVAGRVLTLPT